MIEKKWAWTAVCLGAMIGPGCEQETPTAPPPASTASELAEPSEQAEVAQATEAATTKAAKLLEDAQPLLDQAKQYIEENKLDLADQSLAKLEGMPLPEAMMKKVQDARTLLDAKKKLDQAQEAGNALEGFLNN